MIFPYWVEPLDPQDQKEYSFRFLLLPGESIVSAQVDQVDATSTTPLALPTLVFGPKNIGVISGQLWGVTQWITSATEGGYVAYVRCMITTDYASPLPHKFTRSMRLTVAQL